MRTRGARLQPTVVQHLIRQVGPGEVTHHHAGPTNEDVTDAVSGQWHPAVVANLKAAFGVKEIVLGGQNAARAKPLPRNCRIQTEAQTIVGATRLWGDADGVIAIPRLRCGWLPLKRAMALRRSSKALDF